MLMSAATIKPAKPSHGRSRPSLPRKGRRLIPTAFRFLVTFIPIVGADELRDRSGTCGTSALAKSNCRTRGVASTVHPCGAIEGVAMRRVSLRRTSARIAGRAAVLRVFEAGQSRCAVEQDLMLTVPTELTLALIRTAYLRIFLTSARCLLRFFALKLFEPCEESQCQNS
jgi:hypothetical protein